MPSFEQIILSSPSGFVQSCLALNKLAAENEEILLKLVLFAWKDVMANGSPLDSELQGYENEKDGLTHIVRAMKSAQPTVGISAAAKILLSSSLLIQESVEKILMQVKELSKASAGENNYKKKSSTIENFQWRLGVATASSTCKNLFDPFVSVSFNVVNEDGSTNPFNAELTLDQFKELKQCFEKAARAMDSI